MDRLTAMFELRQSGRARQPRRRGRSHPPVTCDDWRSHPLPRKAARRAAAEPFDAAASFDGFQTELSRTMPIHIAGSRCGPVPRPITWRRRGQPATLAELGEHDRPDVFATGPSVWRFQMPAGLGPPRLSSTSICRAGGSLRCCDLGARMDVEEKSSATASGRPEGLARHAFRCCACLPGNQGSVRQRAALRFGFNARVDRSPELRPRALRARPGCAAAGHWAAPRRSAFQASTPIPGCAPAR